MGSKAEKHQLERWNTHFSTVVEQEVLGVTLRLAQDPNSEHLGTTVWDASIVLAKFFEKNIRKGDFSRPKATGKRAIELGAGMGLAGLAFALIGANVVLTDVAAVMPLLARNYENNASPAALRSSGNESHLCSCGKVTVAELDWSVPAHYEVCSLRLPKKRGVVVGVMKLCPPAYDYVLAADCIYHEHLVRHLYRVMLAVTNERTNIIIANERRSESVQSAFVDLFSHSFTFKKVPLSKQDPDFSHQVIELWILKRKKGANDDNLREMEAAEQQQQQQGGDAVAEAGDPLQPLPPLQQQQEGGQQQQSSPRKQQPSDSSSGAAQLQADLTQLKLQGGGQ